jgi:hypothetical protein
MNSTADTGAADRDEWYFARVINEDGDRYTVHTVRQRPTSKGHGLEILVDWSLSLFGGGVFRSWSRVVILDNGRRRIEDVAGYSLLNDSQRKAIDDLVSYCVAAGTFNGYGCVDYVLENEVGIGNPFEPWPAAETEVSA